MVRLVPLENDIISVVPGVNMLLIKRTYFLMGSGWVQGNSDGPLVLMVRFIPIENDVIPMVLVVNMHLMKGNYISSHVI